MVLTTKSGKRIGDVTCVGYVETRGKYEVWEYLLPDGRVVRAIESPNWDSRTGQTPTIIEDE